MHVAEVLAKLAQVLGPDWWLVPTGLVVLVAGLGLARWLAPRDSNLRFGSAVAFFGASAAAYVIGILVPWAGMRSAFGAFAEVAFALLLARLSFVVLFDGAMAQRRRELPRIARDLIQGGAFFFAALTALHDVGVEPTQLLATSALLTVVAGMALQETLGNLVAGLALQAEKPFKVGDWIELPGPGAPIGRARELTWRAARLYTLDNVELVVPSAALAKASLINHDHLGAPRRSIYFTAPMTVAPLEIQEAVLPAILSTPGVLSEPPPSIVTFAFEERGIQYWARYFIADMGGREGIDGAVRERIWYALGRLGVPLTVPHRRIEAVESHEESEARRAARSRARRVEALRQVAIFAPLSEVDVDSLADGSTEARFASGETIVQRGDLGGQMYVVEMGEVAIEVRTERGALEAGRLAAGTLFGETSLRTEAPHSSAFVARGPCQLLVIAPGAFEAALAHCPPVARAVGEKINRRRQTLGATPITEIPEAAPRGSGDLVDRLRNFLGPRGRR